MPIQLDYNEKLVEELIRDFPMEMLDEQLTLFGQQETLGGFRPDLIFVDSAGVHVIVEVQIHALDRTHLYKSLEYRDLFALKHGCAVPRMIVFCNDLPERFKPILNTHAITCVVMSQDDVIGKAKTLSPGLAVRVQPPKSKLAKPKTTISNLLTQLQDAGGTNSLEVQSDTVAMWLLPFGDPQHELREYKAKKLEDLDQQYENFNRENNTRAPLELFVLVETLSELKLADVDRLRSLLLAIRANKALDDNDDGLIDFGGPDHYDRRRATYSIRQMQTVDRIYSVSGDHGFDFDAIIEDCRRLHRIEFYGGKYPDMSRVSICENWVTSNVGTGDSRRLDVEFFRFNSGATQALFLLLLECQTLYRRGFDGYVADNIRRIGLRRPRPLREIPGEALELSAWYFQHILPTRDPDLPWR